IYQDIRDLSPCTEATSFGYQELGKNLDNFGNYKISLLRISSDNCRNKATITTIFDLSGYEELIETWKILAIIE
ncbi:16514_t:CDS:2, partial [Racocetra persica]